MRDLIGKTTSLLGVILYLLLNWSYTVAVFTDPGSPLTQTTSAYSIVPSSDDDPELNINSPVMDGGPAHSSVTVKSSGEMRYCKKCHTRKPDRAHHCSSCRRCVLKMDHHCPWLATCVGFRNQKAFILFLIYVSLFCWLCFAVSATWVVAEFFGELQVSDALMPVNFILLVVLAGVIGLVITGFTGWHIYLASTGQTTIESLEKTRYITPLRKSMSQPPFAGGDDEGQRHYVGQDKQQPQDPSIGTQLRNIHANVIPGVTRPEEGVYTPDRSKTPANPNLSPAKDSLRQHLNSTAYHQNRELEQERARYEAYQAERDSERLPHAFNHGWKRNMTQLFGERLALAWLPVCNSTGDGWNWEPSQKWLEARDELERERAARRREEEAFSRDRMETMPAAYGQSTGPSSSSDDDDVPLARRMGRGPPPPPPRGSSRTPVHPGGSRIAHPATTSDWNDIPQDFLAPGGQRSRSRSPAAGKARKNG